MMPRASLSSSGHTKPALATRRNEMLTIVRMLFLLEHTCYRETASQGLTIRLSCRGQDPAASSSSASRLAATIRPYSDWWTAHSQDILSAHCGKGASHQANST